MYSVASFTVLIFSASSSGISRSKASSNCITSSTTSSESAPRSSWKLAPGVTSASSTCNCSTMICLTFSSTAMRASPHFLQSSCSFRGVKPYVFRLPTIPACGTEIQPPRQKFAHGPETPSLPGGWGCVKAGRFRRLGTVNTEQTRHQIGAGNAHRKGVHLANRKMGQMMQTVIAGIAILVGIALGYWIRGKSSKAEKVLLEQHNREAAEALALLRGQLAQSQTEASTRAGFESLAAEREKTVDRLMAERDAVRVELQASHNAGRAQAARISQLEAELKGERQNLTEKLALLETAKQALANQFQALAAEILDQKSKSFAEGSQKEIGNLLNPLKTQIEDFKKRVEEAQTDSKTGVATLQGLVGSLNNLNQQLSEDARNLTSALRGSAKAQGDWGEFILRDLLEKAGLREGEQYSFQQTFTGVGGENGERSRS